MATATIDGFDLFYKEGGKGSPVLLIHGTQPDGDVWGECFEELTRDHRVISYDRRGFSRSVHPPIKDYRRHTADAAALLRRLGAIPATVVGWSWGCIVALDLAAGHPELVSSLVLIEPAVHLKKHPTATLVKTMLKVQILRRIKGEQAAAGAFLRWACRYTSGGSAFDRYPEALREIVRRNASALLTEVDAGTGEDLPETRISSVRHTVTFLRGELSDPSFQKAIDRLVKLLPQGEVRRVPGAGHAVHFDQPSAFTDAVRQAAGRDRQINSPAF
jgi:pimeloyl-ACP methyl ester carboxylesterase